MSTIIEDDDYFEFSESANPNKFTFLDSLEISKEVKSRLSILLSRTVKGSNEVFVSAIAKSVSPQDALKGWDSIFNNTIDANDKVLIDFELSNRDKFGCL